MKTFPKTREELAAKAAETYGVKIITQDAQEFIERCDKAVVEKGQPLSLGDQTVYDFAKLLLDPVMANAAMVFFAVIHLANDGLFDSAAIQLSLAMRGYQPPTRTDVVDVEEDPFAGRNIPKV